MDWMQQPNEKEENEKKIQQINTCKGNREVCQKSLKVELGNLFWWNERKWGTSEGMRDIFHVSKKQRNEGE